MYLTMFFNSDQQNPMTAYRHSIHFQVGQHVYTTNNHLGCEAYMQMQACCIYANVLGDF